MKQYDISYSMIFAMAHGAPYVVQVEGSPDTWSFKTEKDARDFVASRKDGTLRNVHTAEKWTFEKWQARQKKGGTEAA